MEPSKDSFTDSSPGEEPASAADSQQHLLIYGELKSGKQFRPSDWCDRLRSTLKVLDDEEAEEYQQYIHVVNHEGKKCVMLDDTLAKLSPPLYRFFVRFSEDNDLITKTIDNRTLSALKK